MAADESANFRWPIFWNLSQHNNALCVQHVRLHTTHQARLCESFGRHQPDSGLRYHLVNRRRVVKQKHRFWNFKARLRKKLSNFLPGSRRVLQLNWQYFTQTHSIRGALLKTLFGNSRSNPRVLGTYQLSSAPLSQAPRREVDPNKERGRSIFPKNSSHREEERQWWQNSRDRLGWSWTRKRGRRGGGRKGGREGVRAGMPGMMEFSS